MPTQSTDSNEPKPISVLQSMRLPERPWHKKQIISVEWSYHSPSLLLVAGADRQVSVWDTENQREIGDEDDEEVEQKQTAPVSAELQKRLDAIPQQFMNCYMGEFSPKEAHWHSMYPGLAMTCGEAFHLFKFANITFD